MGREIKRIALDFDYPINGMIWKGYHNPYSPLKCSACNGEGNTPEYQKIVDGWYGFTNPSGVGWCHSITQDEVQALLDDGRLMDFTRVPRNEQQKEDVKKKLAAGGNSWLPYDNGYIPTADEVNEWSKKGFGHDCINKWICCEARAKRLGIKETKCKHCKGEGSVWPDEKYEKLAEDFEYIEPPEGNGYQLWSTTTEGHPMSPVFAEPEQLAQWLSDSKASSFGDSTASYEQWLKFIKGPGWCPSAVLSQEGLKTGVQAI